MPLPKAESATPRRLLRDEVYEKLFEAILQHTLVPGEVLKDAELSGWLGISRSPIRDALLRLAEIGFVEFKPSSYTRVAPLDERKVIEASVVHGALVEHSVKKTFGTLTAEQVASLKAINTDLQESAGPSDLALTLYKYFHQIVAFTGNELLLKAYRENSPLVLRFFAQGQPIDSEPGHLITPLNESEFRTKIQTLTVHAENGDAAAGYEVTESFTRAMRSAYIDNFCARPVG